MDDSSELKQTPLTALHRELGARDSLRLETGLCLNGHVINGVTTPVEVVKLPFVEQQYCRG